MANEVVIHIKAIGDDAAVKVVASMKPKMAAAGKDLGKATGEAVSGAFAGNLDLGKTVDRERRKVEKQTPIKIPTAADNPIDAAWRAKLESSLKTTAKNALKIPVTPESEGFRRELSRMLDQATSSLHADVPMDLKDAAAFRTQVEALARSLSEEVNVRVPVEVDKSSLSKVAAQFNVLKFTALSVGLPAAAAVGVAGVVGALALLPVAAIAAGALLQQSNVAVSDSYGKLADQFIADSEAMSAVMAGPLVQASEKLGASWKILRPQAEQVFLASSGYVDTLAGAVTDLAERAMPGIVIGTRAAGPALQGIRDLAGQTGSGVSEMLINMSRSSAEAGAGFSLLGGMVRDFLGFVGNLSSNLAHSSGELGVMRSALQQVEQFLLTATQSGGAFVGMLSGATSTLGGTAGVLNGVLGLINQLPQGLSQFGGSLVTTSMLASKLGIDAGAGFQGLGAKISEADGIRGKFAAGMSGLAAGAINPAFLAVGVLSVVLGELGRRQQEAAARAADHAREVDALTASLARDSGAVGANTTAHIAKALVDKNAAGNAAALGVSMGMVTQAASGQGGVMTNLVAKADALSISLLAQGNITKEQAIAFQLNTRDLAANGGAASDSSETWERLTTVKGGQLTATENLIGAAGAEQKALADSQEATRQADLAALAAANNLSFLGRAMYDGVDAASPLAGALKSVRDASGDAASKVTQLQTALDIMSGRVPSHEEALQAMQDTIRQLGEDFGKNADHAAGWGKALMNADFTVNTATANGSKLQDSLVTLSTGFSQAGMSIEGLVQSGMSYNDASAQVRGELGQQRDAFIQVATHMGLTAEQARQLADKYHLIPGAVITAVGSPGINERINEASIYVAKLNSIPSERITRIYTETYNTSYNKTVYTSTGQNAQSGIKGGTGPKWNAEGNILAPGVVGFASGGMAGAAPMSSSLAQWVPAGTKRVLGDNPRSRELYAPMNGSARTAALITEAARDQGLPIGGDGGSGAGGGRPSPAATGGGGGRVVLEIHTGGDPMDELIAQLLRRYVRVHGGDVQAVIGA